MIHPPCDCGHAFEPDRWFHLADCAYRLSWRLFRQRWPEFREHAAEVVALHADRRYLTEVRRARGIPAMRTAYARKRRHW